MLPLFSTLLLILGAFYMAENVHNYEVVIDISAIPEFFVNSYDVRNLLDLCK